MYYKSVPDPSPKGEGRVSGKIRVWCAVHPILLFFVYFTNEIRKRITLTRYQNLRSEEGENSGFKYNGENIIPPDYLHSGADIGRSQGGNKYDREIGRKRRTQLIGELFLPGHHNHQ